MSMSNHKDDLQHFAKHGGVQFALNVPETELNQYVNEMPKGQRQSMYNVMKELERAGMITIQNSGVFADGHGNIGGSTTCGDE